MKKSVSREYFEAIENNYWENVFPNSHKHRAVSIIDKSPDRPMLVLDGDIYTDHVNRSFACTVCGGKFSKMKPKMFGSFDVGYRAVYRCPECSKGLARCYFIKDVEQLKEADNGERFLE